MAKKRPVTGKTAEPVHTAVDLTPEFAPSPAKVPVGYLLEKHHVGAVEAAALKPLLAADANDLIYERDFLTARSGWRRAKTGG